MKLLWQALALWNCLTSVAPAQSEFMVKELLRREDVIWAMAFLPDGDMLLTERSGQLLRFNPKTASAQVISDVPPVLARGQGGLMDVALHPKFQENSLIYLTLSAPVGELSTTKLIRAKLEQASFKEVQELFQAEPPLSGHQHYGSRLAFRRDGLLFMTMGERNERKYAQDLSSDLGKVLLLTDSGQPAPGNSFLKTPKARPEIWSYGHPQGIAIDPSTQQV